MVSDTEQMAAMEMQIQKCFATSSIKEPAENTLSNISSIQSKLQSLYETCDDTVKVYDKLNNYNNINIKQTNEKMTRIQQTSNDKNDCNYLKSNDKHSLLMQELNKIQTQKITHMAAVSTGMISSNKSLSPTRDAAAVGSPTKGSNLNTSGAISGKTATILVSKSKTKTGLPLLLKNSINN